VDVLGIGGMRGGWELVPVAENGSKNDGIKRRAEGARRRSLYRQQAKNETPLACFKFPSVPGRGNAVAGPEGGIQRKSSVGTESCHATSRCDGMGKLRLWL
jgi:hypothetical protein